MTNTCPCGIHRADCEYHRVEEVKWEGNYSKDDTWMNDAADAMRAWTYLPTPTLPLIPASTDDDGDDDT